jgi:hypothetical protein
MLESTSEEIKKSTSEEIREFGQEVKDHLKGKGKLVFEQTKDQIMNTCMEQMQNGLAIIFNNNKEKV